MSLATWDCWEHQMHAVKNKRCRDGVACVVFITCLACTLPSLVYVKVSIDCSCLYTAIPIPSFCGFWHRHLYIPLHFWKMFSYLFVYFFSTLKEDVVLATFFQNPTNTSKLKKLKFRREYRDCIKRNGDKTWM